MLDNNYLCMEGIRELLSGSSLQLQVSLHTRTHSIHTEITEHYKNENQPKPTCASCTLRCFNRGQAVTPRPAISFGPSGSALSRFLLLSALRAVLVILFFLSCRKCSRVPQGTPQGFPYPALAAAKEGNVEMFQGWTGAVAQHRNGVSDRAGQEFSSFEFVLVCQGELISFFLYSFFSSIIYRKSDYYSLIESSK